ncbi:lanthionine synthetase C family protein [Rubrobacter xylanophilus]|uniref:lanthionine synthetase C family protein n=1 Tax=Rubrobacter xylanophilus TaxID=49319 RepID=UPI00155B1D47|nr:lanthionine synthetase C family protein [Rubrobacter xylanophilus]
MATAPGNVNPVFNTHPWEGVSLSHGYPGVALLFAELDRLEPEVGWDAAAHEHLAACGPILAAGDTGLPSLFNGVCAVAFAALISSRGRSRYGRLLDRLDALVAERTEQIIHKERVRSKVQTGALASAYDVVSGLSGTGRYLLLASDRPGNHETLLKVLSYLVYLAESVEVGGREVPGWYLPAENQFLRQDRELYPAGNFNCGMAHGIAGPVALLSLASLEGVEVPGQAEAARRMAGWLLGCRRKDDYGYYWPDRVRLEEEIGGVSAGPHIRREAWCYGTPGVARALWLAGRALEDPELREAALEGMASVFRRPPANRNLDGPNFCHGTSGLLRISHRFIQDSQDLEASRLLEGLTEQALREFDPDSAFGFKDKVPTEKGQHGLDSASLLEGAAGVALSLLSVAREGPQRQWDTAFLIA